MRGVRPGRAGKIRLDDDRFNFTDPSEAYTPSCKILSFLHGVVLLFNIWQVMVPLRWASSQSSIQMGRAT
ncbi:hypothetical protein SUGI_0142030 [Cryptomeria japonica]|nr:hypothetical protein SUGI_0142030 [Cryptomeria japonica]